MMDMHSLTRSLHIRNDSKIVLLVADGLGGLPLEPGGLTELETARTPNLDELARRGVSGGLVPVAPGITPGSGPGHLSLFGYDPIQYQIGRGALEATGIGFTLGTDDVAIRCNFCTLDAEGIITDRRAGRIATERSAPLAVKLRDVKIPGAEVFVEPVKEHRFVVVFRGAGLGGGKGGGVGGIEAEAVMLGQPYYLLTPDVIGFRLSGALPEGTTATDLVLTIAGILRKKGVVGKFIEFFGPGLNRLGLPDRATIANMTPEFGATMSYFPVDEETLNYLTFTGRSPEHAAFIKAYLTAQSLFRTDETPAPEFNDIVELDMETIEPSLAGPRHPHARIALKRMKETFLHDFHESGICKDDCVENGYSWDEDGGAAVEPDKLKQRMVFRKPFDDKGIPVNRPYQSFYLDNGAVVIAAITSCTNTSNPHLLVGAGLMAKKAVEKGLLVRPWVKTSLAPGSKVVVDYLRDAGLLPYLEALRFHLVAHGCTTCIGNSGHLQSDVSRVVEETNLIVASVLSGNRSEEHTSELQSH